MNLSDIKHEEFQKFVKLCAPWHVDERLRNEVSYPWAGSFLGGNSKPFSSLLKVTTQEEYEKNINGSLLRIWNEIEETSYSKALTESFDYRSACQKFERKLKSDLHENEKIKKRIMFRYLTGFTIYIVDRIRQPVRLMPDKKTAGRVIKHIKALLKDMDGSNEYAHWADYRLKRTLTELRDKLEAARAVPKVSNSLSPESYFVFELAQRFVQDFGEPMQTVLSDLCRVIGTSPDESTIARWVANAVQHLQGGTTTT